MATFSNQELQQIIFDKDDEIKNLRNTIKELKQQIEDIKQEANISIDARTKEIIYQKWRQENGQHIIRFFNEVKNS